jgi:dihydrofolate reductase
MKVSLIAALSENGVIGVENRLPWNLPEDLKRFRELTTGHPIIMGRKTFESIGRVLSNRRNIIITRNTGYRVVGAEVAHSLEAALALTAQASEVFVIGGAEIYRQALPLGHRLYLTRVHQQIEGDAFFPQWEEKEFRETQREDHPGFSFLVYDRG